MRITKGIHRNGNFGSILVFKPWEGQSPYLLNMFCFEICKIERLIKVVKSASNHRKRIPIQRVKQNESNKISYKADQINFAQKCHSSFFHPIVVIVTAVLLLNGFFVWRCCSF